MQKGQNLHRKREKTHTRNKNGLAKSPLAGPNTKISSPLAGPNFTHKIKDFAGAQKTKFTE